MTGDHPVLLLGAYVLGSLDGDERAQLEAHLADCPDCAAEFAELATLPPLLALLNIEQAVAIDQAATRSHVTKRRRRMFALAAAAVIAVGGVTGGLLATSGSGTRSSFSTTAGSVHMAVQLSPSNAGTALKVSVAGLPVNEHCTLIAVARDGSRHTAGQWTATYSGTAQVTGWTDVTSGQLRQLVLLGTDGQQLVNLNV